jgi:hypothetical protein
VADVIALCVECVRGHRDVGQVVGGQQGGEAGDFVGCVLNT